jgi:hypothetical protein
MKVRRSVERMKLNLIFIVPAKVSRYYRKEKNGLLNLSVITLGVLCETVQFFYN